MKQLSIHPELKDILPPLSESEYAGLKADILKHGCLSPIVIWGNMVVDGHFRLAICEKYGLPYKTKEIQFKSIEEAMLWVWQHQSHRRNLTLYQRGELALKFKPMIAAKAKNNMSMGGRGQCDELTPHNTRNELSQIAGVSEGTLGKAEYLIKHADEETKQRLRNGQTTIHREYNRLKGTLQPSQDINPEKPVIKPMLVLPPAPIVRFRKVWNIDTMTPTDINEFVLGIQERFGKEFLKEFIFVLFAHFVRKQDTEARRHLFQQLYNLHYTPTFSER